MRNTHVGRFKSFARAGISAAILGGSFSLAAAEAQNFDAVQIKTSDLGNGLYMLEGSGGNLGVSVGADGIFLIDDEYAPLTTKILAALADIGAGDVKYILNTHWHGDHTGGNENLGSRGSVIVAHKNVRERMSADRLSERMNQTTPASPDVSLPVVTFDGNVEFYFNGHKIEVMSVVPAHTDGDSIVYIAEANMLHMGDTYFNTWYPYIDVDSGGNIHGMIAVHEKGLALANDTTKIIPGHGPLADKSDLQVAHDKLVDVRDALQAGIDKGMSDEEIIASNPLAGLDLNWGGFLTEMQFVTVTLAGMRG